MGKLFSIKAGLLSKTHKNQCIFQKDCNLAQHASCSKSRRLLEFATIFYALLYCRVVKKSTLTRTLKALFLYLFSFF